MKKLIILGILLVGLVVWHSQSPPMPVQDVPKVLISQVVDHPALNKTTQGIIDALAEAGFHQNENLVLRVESAQANAALAAQIAAQFLHQSPTVVVGIGTISAQSFMQAVAQQKVHLIFSSVTDPVKAKLVSKSRASNAFVSGVSNFVPLEPQLALFHRLQPHLRRLGILYNPGEINSLAIIDRLEVLCREKGWQLVKQAALKTADVPQAAVKLAHSVDAIFISNDNTALAALPSIIQAGNSAHIPVYVSDTDAVRLGALAALGPNQYEIGKQTGRLIARFLGGEPLSHLPVEFPAKTELFLNARAAQQLGIVFPADLVTSAQQIESGKS